MKNESVVAAMFLEVKSSGVKETVTQMAAIEREKTAEN
jgi:hypothetical protein